MKIDKIDDLSSITYGINPNINQTYELALEPGTYIVQVKEDFNLKTEQDYSVNLAVYS